MNGYRLTIFGLIAVFLLGVTLDTAWADRGRRHDDRRPAVRHVDKGHFLDQRHHHNRYYPRHGYSVRHLPHRHHRVAYHGTSYYYSSGIWYHRSGLYFSVVAPPVGVVIPVLPSYYTTVWYGSVPYYYAGGTYYQWYPNRGGYLVVDPPTDLDVTAGQTLTEELYVYPRAGQTEQQQSTDRYQCHSWAVDQTGFDPTRPGGNVSAASNTNRRAAYYRAEKACLEARGYSVQ